MRIDDGSFHELRPAISASLAEPADLLPPRTALRCVAWEFSSFELLQSWSVVSDHGSADGFSVVESTWDQHAAYEAVVARAPIVTETENALKIVRRHAPLDADAIRRVLDEVAGVAVPFVSPAQDPASVGLDGTTFGFTLYGVQNHSKLSWREKGPAAWRDVVAWAARLRAHLREATERRGAPLPPIDPTWALVVETNDANLTTATKVLREELRLAIADVSKLKEALRSGATLMRSARPSVERVAAAVRDAGLVARVFASAERDSTR